MKFPIVKIKKNGFKNKSIKAMSIFEWQWFANREVFNDEIVRNHENIHTRFWRITGYFGGLIIYGLFFIVKGYWNNPIEIEAYVNQSNLNYLKNLKWYQHTWIKYVFKKLKKDKRGNIIFEV